ncbi:MAG TPA: phosphohistidine phosphatase SixA [Verrucomicrobiae bacterium]|nr:phosphohistidine phosphatase SixA [Verrucomicrobiae bacterium]
MNIFLLRHGIAVERGSKGIENDSERPLTGKGRRQLRTSATAMKRMNLRLDLILSSPYVRARQTAEIIAEELKLKKRLKLSDTLKSENDAQSAIREIMGLKPTPENVLLVGHEPYLSHLISRLVSGNGDLAMDFKKGGLCKLEMEKPGGVASAQLVWLLTPKLMKEMA